MRVLWTATNRVSRSGSIIGEEERLSPYEALKCITEWSAYQHFEEKTKGTLGIGKLADLVILDSNPLTVDKEKIKDIIVSQLGIEEDKVLPAADFIKELDADSLDVVELVMAFEDAFDIEIEDEDASQISTVGDAIKFIQNAL